MAVALVDDLGVVRLPGAGAFLDVARVRPEAHGAALVDDVFLRVHEADDRIRPARRELHRIRLLHAADGPRVLDRRALHAEAEAEERDLFFAGPADRRDLPL